MPRPPRAATRPVNDEEVLADLDRRAQGYGAGARLARDLGVAPSHLREMKSGRRPPSRKIAAGLGWELRWVRKQSPAEMKAGAGVKVVKGLVEGR